MMTLPNQRTFRFAATEIEPHVTYFRPAAEVVERLARAEMKGLPEQIIEIQTWQTPTGWKALVTSK